MSQNQNLCRHYGGQADCPPICLLIHNERWVGQHRHTDNHNPKIEPDADSREIARILRQQYLALTGEGFTETQACMILGQIMVAGGIANAITERDQGDD